MRAILLSALLLALSPAAQAAPGPLHDRIVDVIEDAQPVREVLRRLEAKHGLDYVVTEETLASAGSVTVKLRQVPLDDALEAICAACNLSLQIRGSILIILPRTKPLLPRVEEGILPRGAKRSEPLRPAPPRKSTAAPPRKPAAPPRFPEAAASSMVVGTVVTVDMKNGRLHLDADGVKRDLYLPSAVEADGHELQAGKLRRALARLSKGDRVALLYRRNGTRPLITDLIGGQAVRGKVSVSDAHAARLRPRRRTQPRPAPRDDASATTEPLEKELEGAKTEPAPPVPTDGQPAVPEGVLAGKFVGRDGEIVKIRRADGQIVECHLPPAGATRDKVEAVIAKLPEGAKVFMTFQRDADGKTVLKGGLSEVR